MKVDEPRVESQPRPWLEVSGHLRPSGQMVGGELSNDRLPLSTTQRGGFPRLLRGESYRCVS